MANPFSKPGRAAVLIVAGVIALLCLAGLMISGWGDQTAIGVIMLVEMFFYMGVIYATGAVTQKPDQSADSDDLREEREERDRR